MPLGEIAVGLISGAVRLIVTFFLEIVLEILVRGPGYLICRIFKKDVDPDDGLAAVVGLLFWAVLFFGCYFIISHY